MLRSLLHITSPPFQAEGSSIEVIIAYEIRSLTKETPFWSAFGLWFTYEPVLSKPKLGDISLDDPVAENAAWRRHGSHKDADGSSYVFIARRRPESYGWIIPESDSELLDGVYARGTTDKKSDDAFEMLLLMKMDDDAEFN